MRKFLAMLLVSMVVGFAGSALAAGPEDTWKISGPANNSNANGPDVTVTVDPGQVKIVAPGAVKDGEGHWHFFVDGKEVGKGPTNTFVFKDLAAGKHVLGVELHKGDHSVYGKGQEVTVNVTLPNTGTNMTLYIIGGVALLAVGAYAFTRKGAAKV